MDKTMKNYDQMKIMLEKTGKTVCVNFIPWLCCAVFMLPSLPVSSIFGQILKKYLMVDEQISSFIAMLIFISLAVFPIFLIPQSEYKKKRR
jgi:hypothetical protein